MTVRACLFDYGGTLDGEGWHWFDRTVHLYRKAGCVLPVEGLKRAFYHADEQIEAEAAREGYRLRPLMERHLELQIDVLGPQARPFAKAVVDGFCDMTETGWRRARAALGTLRGRVKLGVVSNFYGNLDAMLDESGLGPMLDVVVESVKVGLQKPDPAIYRLAAERLAIPAAECVMVGDNLERDVNAARRAGLRAIWLRRADLPPATDDAAEGVVTSLADAVAAFPEIAR